MIESPALKRIRRARSALLITQPFWGILALGMELEEVSTEQWIALFQGTNTTPTMATNGAKIFFHGEFVLKLPEPQLIGVTAHEVEHVARCHHTRRGNRDAKEWNISCDHSINPSLLAGGFRLPAFGLGVAPNGERYPLTMSAEEIYAARRKAANKRPQASQGAPGAPGGAGAPSQPVQGQFGEVLDALPGASKSELAEIEAETIARVHEAAMIAKRSEAGKDAGGASQILNQLARGRVDWRESFRRFADDSNIRDTCWTRPSRRFAGQAIVMPSTISVAPSHIVFVVDSSGSMDVPALKACGAEVQSALDQGAVERITLIYADTIVQSVQTYEQGDTIAFDAKGRGGTKFAPAFKWIADNAPDASAAIYLTDMDSNDLMQLAEPTFPVLWACTGKPCAVPFGEVLQLDPYN